MEWQTDRGMTFTSGNFVCRGELLMVLLVHLVLGLPSSLFPSGFPTKHCMHFTSAPYMPHVLPIACGNVSVAQLDWQVAAVPVGLGWTLMAD